MAGADATEPRDEEIRAPAHQSSQSPDPGSDEENWLGAEEELRNGAATAKKKPRARTPATQAS